MGEEARETEQGRPRREASSPAEQAAADLQAMRERLANGTLIALGFIGPVCLAASLARIPVMGWHPIFVLHTIAAAILVASAVWRRRLPYQVRAAVIIWIYVAVAVAGLLGLGLASPGIGLLVVVCVLATLLQGIRAAVVSVVGSLLLIAAIGIAASTRLLTFSPDFNRLAHSPTAWIAQITTMAYVGGTAAVATGLLLKQLVQALEGVRHSRQRYTDIFHATSDAIIVHDAETGELLSVNDRMLELYGGTREGVLASGLETVVSGIEPYTIGNAEKKVRSAVTDGPQTFEWQGRRIDTGENFWVEATLRLVSIGGEQRVLATIHDITQRKADEKVRRLLSSELDHRVKNNLAAVLALISTTRAATDDLDTFHKTFEGRVRSMAVAHEALAQHRWEGASIREVVDPVLHAFQRECGTRVRIEGEDIMLPARAAGPVAMCIHELATNAAKYGSLSAANGRIELICERADGQILMHWSELDGPAAAPPDKPGGGMSIIRGLIEYELAGKVHFDFTPEGLRCDLSVPASA